MCSVVMLPYPPLCYMLYYAQSSKSLHATARSYNVTAYSKVLLKNLQSFSDAKYTLLFIRSRFYVFSRKPATCSCSQTDNSVPNLTHPIHKGHLIFELLLQFKVQQPTHV